MLGSANANPTLCFRTSPRLSPSGTACPMPPGLGSWPWCGPREGEFGWATSDRELPEGVIGSRHRRRQAWTLAPGPHRPGRTLSLACLVDSSTSASLGIPSRTNSLKEKKACPTVDPRRGGESFSKTLFEERTSESAQRHPPRTHKKKPSDLRTVVERLEPRAMLAGLAGCGQSPLRA